MPQKQAKPRRAARLKPHDIFQPGSIADRVELQLGVLTQGVIDCMALATGAYSDLTEGPADAPNDWRKARPTSSWQTARSAELRDAARLSEASARLLAGFAKLRGQFSQNFTIRHTDGRGGKAKAQQQNTMLTHSFSLPGKQAVAEDATPTAAGLTRGLAKIAGDMAQRRAQEKNGGESPREKLARVLDELARAHDATAEAAGDGATPSSGS